MDTAFQRNEFAANETACWAYAGARRRLLVWIFGVDGWTPPVTASAVIDDFGTLIKVEDR